MKDELLKIAHEVLTEEEVQEIVKEKFKDAFKNAVGEAFRWGDAEKAVKNKITEVMVPYIEKYDFTEFLPKLDTVLTEIVNSDGCIAEKRIIENFKGLMLEPEQKEIKVTELFRAWIKQCNKKIDVDGLEVCYDDGVCYEPVDCEMQFEEEDKPTWSSFQHGKIIFENDHDKSLNIEIPVTQYINSYGKNEPYSISLSSDIKISSLRRLSDFEVLLLRLERAGTAIIIDKEWDSSYIEPEKEPEATFV